MMAATTSMRRSLRRKDNSIPNACSTRRNGPPLQQGRAAKFSFTVIVDGKRALSGAEKGKEIGQWPRQAPHSPSVMPGQEPSFDRREYRLGSFVAVFPSPVGRR
jgi:hypothetical protein